MQIDYSCLQPGMEVYGADAERLGQVREVRTSGFVMDTQSNRPHFIPREVITEISEAEHRVDLSIPKDELKNIDWKNPMP